MPETTEFKIGGIQDAITLLQRLQQEVTATEQSLTRLAQTSQQGNPLSNAQMGQLGVSVLQNLSAQSAISTFQSGIAGGQSTLQAMQGAIRTGGSSTLDTSRLGSLGLPSSLILQSINTEQAQAFDSVNYLQSVISGGGDPNTPLNPFARYARPAGDSMRIGDKGVVNAYTLSNARTIAEAEQIRQLEQETINTPLNPFARYGRPVGAATSIAQGGVVNAQTIGNARDEAMVKQREQWEQMVGGGSRSRGLAEQLSDAYLIQTLANSFTKAIDLASQQVVTGRVDRMQSAQNAGNAFGALAGVGIGLATGNPMVGAIAASTLSQLGGSLFGWMEAGEQRAVNVRGALSPIAATLAQLRGAGNVDYGDESRGPALATLGLVSGGKDGKETRFSQVSPLAGSVYQLERGRRYAEVATSQIEDVWRQRYAIAGITRPNTGEIVPTPEEFAQSYAGVSSSLINAGIDPLQAREMVSGLTQGTDPLGRYRGQFSGAGGQGIDPLFRAQINNGGLATIEAANLMSRRRLTMQEDLAGVFTRRAAETYGRASGDVLKGISPILSSQPDTSGNLAEILDRYGVERTNQYLQITGNEFSEQTDLRTLMVADRGMRRARRTQRMGALQIRGGAGEMVSALDDEMEVLEGLPGGRESLTYASARRNQSRAYRAMYEERDALDFGIPMAHLQGERDRMMLLPFSPSNVLGNSVRMGNMAGRQARELESRMDTERRAGRLSADDELEMTQRIEGLKTLQARTYAELSEGAENRLPALAAGRPSFFGRFNSMQLAALSVQGTAYRGFGAVNGAQLAEQNTFAEALGGVGNPSSRTAGLNAGGNERLVTALERLTTVIERSNSGGLASSRRPQDAAGAVSAFIYGKRDEYTTGGAN